jgi:transcriptional regulator with XRE-family HTH domain
MKIKELIKAKGLSVKEVAARLGISSPSLSDAINGNPTVDKLEKIAEAIGCNISDFFDKPDTHVTCPHCGKEIKIEVK